MLVDNLQVSVIMGHNRAQYRAIFGPSETVPTDPAASPASEPIPAASGDVPLEQLFLQGVAPEELCRRLASRVRKMRTEHQLSQALFASACGISLRTYKRFEASGQVTLENFLRVVSAMGRTSALALLFPPPSPQLSTLEAARRRIEVRQLIVTLHEGRVALEARGAGRRRTRTGPPPGDPGRTTS